MVVEVCLMVARLQRRFAVDKYLEESINQGYKDLANAIVMQAIIDYKESPKDVSGDLRRTRIERFIKSRFFTDICDINQEWLIDALKSEQKKVA